MNLDAGSENGDNPEGNCTLADGSAILVPQEYLSLGDMELLLTINAITLAEKDSLLLEEPDFYLQR